MTDQDRRNSDRRKEGRDRLLSEAEVARLAGVSPLTVKYWRQVGLLPYVKVGRHPRVWLSVFQGIYQKPQTGLVYNLKGETGNINTAWDVRRGA